MQMATMQGVPPGMVDVSCHYARQPNIGHIMPTDLRHRPFTAATIIALAISPGAQPASGRRLGILGGGLKAEF